MMKHTNETEVCHDEPQVAKKFKQFSAKHFRSQLKTNDKLNALKDFLAAIKSQSHHDYIFEYLESGGNCLELLNTLETDSSIPPVVVFDLVALVLLNINAKYSQFHSSAYEACRYLINNYLTVIHKMLGLSSSKEERKACLKLLTSMVTFSSTLAKDVLLNVKFHSSNIELLTKDTVRDGFIHFLCAFLVDGHYPTISLLLERAGLFTSIISGLQYDNADTVCIVIGAMKTYILEHPSMYKTAKMKVFNTLVVREIVKLYNWKGPQKSKKETGQGEVDIVAKSRVSECVHDCLMVLCTSHKNGVIFRDPLVGLGKKNQNRLMFTVLESLDRPWEHSYASQLVIGICRACPDLVKTVWTNLKPFLEPRLTDKWLKAMTFAGVLLKELDLDFVEISRDLTAFQLSQIVEILAMPLPILKTVLVDSYDNLEIKRNVLLLLMEMLYSVEKYMKCWENYLDSDSYSKLKKYLSEYLFRNFPSAKFVLQIENISKQESTQYLAVAIDILMLYKKIAPHLLTSLEISDTFFNDLLKHIDSFDSQGILLIKIINLLNNFDSSKLSPRTELYDLIMPILLKNYHTSVDIVTFKAIHNILSNTTIFEGCQNEEILWIDGILNIKHFDNDTAKEIADIFKICAGNISKYQQELSVVTSKNYEQNDNTNYKNIIDDLLMQSSKDDTFILKQKGISPMIAGLLEYLSQNTSKNLRKYAEFTLINLVHIQNDCSTISIFAEEYINYIPKKVFEYIKNCASSELTVFSGFKGRLSVFQNYCQVFLNDKFNNDFLKELNLNLYPHLMLNLLQAATFYFTHSNNSASIISENWISFIKYLSDERKIDESCFDIILGNSILLQRFSIFNLDNKKSNISSSQIIEVIKNFLTLNYDIDKYIALYREKIVNNILKITFKPQNYNNMDLSEILNVFNLNYCQCIKILKNMTDFFNNNQNCHIPIMYDISNYCLQQVSTLCFEHANLNPLEPELIKSIGSYFLCLSKKNVDVNILSNSLKKYLEIFPHSIEYLDNDFISSIDYSKETINLCCFLLERRKDYLNKFKNNIDKFLDNKSVLMPLLDVLLGKNLDIDLETVYEKLEPFLSKMLQKPQKSGHYFQQNKNIFVLIDRVMPQEKCLEFFRKVQKFEVSEPFHARLLQSVATKIIDENLDEKIIHNIMLTFIHLQINLFKRSDNEKVSEIATIFCRILQLSLNLKQSSNIAANESVKLYFKSCLKFGIAGNAILLETLIHFLNFFGSKLDLDEGRLILGMLLSHSMFLDIIMTGFGEVKCGVISLFYVLCKNFPTIMERSHIPLLLSAYGGTTNKSDKTILELLKMYESNAEKTNFYDFKPILWGRAAAAHYSVRIRIESTIINQPKMSDVLNILREHSVNSTIKNYDVDTSYDLSFLLPLFSQLLAPEQQVKTYLFTQSGALSLTVLGLASEEKETRQAACHVLSRFHFHLEAKHTGKDSQLWVRYVEALCKGTAALPDFKLNNFAAIFFARMALILTQPKDVMYCPLSRYLTAKADLDLRTIPELYTLLHSSEINCKSHQIFILKLVRDGVRNAKDFADLLKSMAYKLFSELYSSSLSDPDTKLLILDAINSICRLPIGCKILCENNSILPYLTSILSDALCEKNAKNENKIVSKIVEIFLNFINGELDKYSSKTIYNNVVHIVNSDLFKNVQEQCQRKCFEIVYRIYNNFNQVVIRSDFDNIINNNCDRYCSYIAKYGCKYLREEDFLSLDDKYYFLRQLFYKMFGNKQC